MHSSGLRTNSSSPLPEWYNTYLTAVLEPDEQKALIQLERATKVLEDRVVQLRCDPPEDPQEVPDLSSALTYLRLLLNNINPDYGIAHC